MKRIGLIIMGLLAHGAFANYYSVPAPEEFKEAARFKDTKATAVLKDGVLSVTYDLPTELAGKHCIDFTGKVNGNFAQVSGKGVNGVCLLSKGKPLTCMLCYPDLIIDEAAGDDAIKQSMLNRIAGQRC